MMRAITTLTFIGLVLGVVVLGEMSYGLASSKLASNSIRLRTLAEGLVNLRSKVDDARDDDSSDAFEELHNRLALLES